jgi:arylsulfatase A-like enzyme
LIVSVPGFKFGQACDRLVEFVDLYPTLMDLTGLRSVNTGLEGTSFKTLLGEPHLKWKRAAFSKFGPAESLITNQFNYAEFDDGQKMLFDLRADPNENVNLADSPEYKKTLNRLGNMLREGWRSVLPSETKR